MKKNIPEKSIERLSQYRRTLLNFLKNNKVNIYSHELAAAMHITSVQVRRDLMLIGYSGSQSKGYDISDLVSHIAEILDDEKGQNVAVIGVGNMGRAITSYLTGRRPKLNIVALFDIDNEKVNRMISGVYCYHIEKLEEIFKKENIKVAILTVPADASQQMATKLVIAGVKGILNYTPVPLKVSSSVFIAEYDIITSLEKVAYYAKNNNHI
ncbi:MAG: redox-sensing transcriptional repressor Rex [Bacteroidota bacterium]|nr:redox-sensing transcriptional repressor Rex [Bacteroidota bacterium]